MKKICAGILFVLMAVLSVQAQSADKQEIRNIQLVGPQNEKIDFKQYSRIFYVSIKSGFDYSGDGSKQNPWKTINHGLLKLAGACETNRYALLIAAGRYNSDTIEMKNYIDLYGGFLSDTWKRDIFKNTTLLDGKRVRRVVVGADHSRIDGFTITRGLSRSHGGGIICDDTSPVISNNFIIDNFVLESENFNRHRIHQEGNQGGGIACLYNAVPVIRNNVIANNKTSIGCGGGISFFGWRRVSGDPDPQVENNMISGGKQAVVKNNILFGNVAGINDVTDTRSSSGGGISCAYEARPIIMNNVIANNQAKGNSDAGGIYCEYFSYPEITGNWIIGNVCEDDGGGFYAMRMSQPILRQNIFAGNKSMNGGVGGIRLSKEGRALISNNTIVFNLSGGGVRCIDSYMVLKGNIIMNNRGGGIIYSNRFSYFIPSVIRKNIVRDNDNVQLQIAGNAGGPVIMNGNNITGEYAGTGQYDSDPGFLKDGLNGRAESTRFDPIHFTTNIMLTRPIERGSHLIGRVLRLGDKWSVIKNTQKKFITVWGNLSFNATEEIEFQIIPTFRSYRSQSK